MCPCPTFYLSARSTSTRARTEAPISCEEVGIGGNFLSEWHMVEYMRSSWWKHDLFPRQTFPEGELIQTARQRAQERAQTIIAENRTDEPVIDGAQCAMLDKIVQDALDHLDA